MAAKIIVGKIQDPEGARRFIIPAGKRRDIAGELVVADIKSNQIFS